MTYTKDYYHILSLEEPSWRPAKQSTTADLRRAYKVALLATHPDKRRAVDSTKTKQTGYTVDDIKEAYTILADPKTRADYDHWFLHNRDTLRLQRHSSHDTQAAAPSNDFILGLELLDLSEFRVIESSDVQSTNHTSGLSSGTNPTGTGENEEQEQQTQWVRECRCGADKGFRILEEELEGAEERGENEVLVGCEGCSLWVRVGFDVEEEV